MEGFLTTLPFAILLIIAGHFRRKAFNRFIVEIIISLLIFVIVSVHGSLTDAVTLFTISFFFSFLHYRVSVNGAVDAITGSRSLKFRFCGAVVTTSLFLLAMVQERDAVEQLRLDLSNQDTLGVLTGVIVLFLIMKRPGKWKY